MGWLRMWSRGSVSSQGTRVLGALIEDPQPIRLPRIADDPRSSGFPAGHPPMTTFLVFRSAAGMRCLGTVFDRPHRWWRVHLEDEELVLALAATAGVAIENARLCRSRRRQEWLRASGRSAGNC